MPRFEQTEEIASFFTVTLSHSAENPLGSPGERGSRAKAAHGAKAPLAQTAIVTTRRRAAGPRLLPTLLREGRRERPRWQGLGRGPGPAL